MLSLLNLVVVRKLTLRKSSSCWVVQSETLRSYKLGLCPQSCTYITPIGLLEMGYRAHPGFTCSNIQDPQSSKELLHARGHRDPCTQLPKHIRNHTVLHRNIRGGRHP